MVSPSLQYLKQFPRFIIYKTAPRAGSDKLDKVPVDFTGAAASAHDPQQWLSYENAQAIKSTIFPGDGYGIGVTVTSDTKVFCLDIDGALMPNGQWSPLAQEVCAMLPGAAVEVSISGKGLHIWGAYTGDEPAHAKRAAANGLELYTSGRFIALGNQNTAVGNAGTDCTAALQRVIATYFPQSTKDTLAEKVWAEGHQLGWTLPEDDELIERALRFTPNANSVWGNKVTFAHLSNRDVAALSAAFPDPNGREFDESQADLALASKLAWPTGNDCPRIERLMRRSGLAREKWDSHRTYLCEFTIPRALRTDDDFYDPQFAERRRQEQTPAAGGPTLMLTREDRALLNVGTQDAIALLFRKQMAGKMLYDHTRGQWLEWDGTRWKSDRTRKAYNFIRDISANENHEHKAAMASASFCEGVEKHLKNDPTFARTRDEFDRDNYLLNTPAGAIDLRTGTIRAHDPADMLTLCTTAAASERGGEEFRKFLSEITQGDAGLSEFLKVSLGACLSGAVENHWMLFWIGNGRNGKNTLGDLVQDAMGDYAKKVAASTLMAKSFESHPTEIANLQGVRLATSSEVNDSDHWDEARINEVTGDARLSGRFMRCDHFEFERTHKHLIYGNYKPQLRSVSDGIRSRIKIVPFNASFKGREDANLPSRLRKNLGFVLSWLIEGHRQWIANNKQLPICPTVEAESEQYFEGQATPQRWLGERCELVPIDGRPDIHLPKVNDLYRDYKAWKETRGEKAVSQARWAEAAMRGFDKVRSMKGQHYRGVRLLPQTEGLPFIGVPYPPPPGKPLLQ